MNLEGFWVGDKAKALAREGVIDGLNKIALAVQAKSVTYAPKDQGDLRASLTVKPATADDPEATVGSDLPYAAIQHESLHFHHTDGQAKYLETAIDDIEPVARNIIDQAVTKKLRSG